MVELLEIRTESVLLCKELTMMSLSNSHWMMMLEIRLTMGQRTWGCSVFSKVLIAIGTIFEMISGLRRYFLVRMILSSD
jgi:hypothetical protein